MRIGDIVVVLNDPWESGCKVGRIARLESEGGGLILDDESGGNPPAFRPHDLELLDVVLRRYHELIEREQAPHA